LMIAVGIIAIAAAIATPGYLRWLSKSQLRQAATEIATQMTLARMSGMNQNRSVDVTVQNTGGQIHISAVTSSGSTPGTLVIKDKAFTSGVLSVLVSPVTVSFSSLGLRTSGGTGLQTIGVCDRYKRQYAVTIIPSGKVNWSENATSCP
jgi:Tfp pilus assembly protein FimT